MNIHRIYIYTPFAGTYPTDLEQALAQGEQLRQAGEGHEVPKPLLSMAENLEDYVRGLSEGCEEEAADDPLLSDLEDLILGLKDWLLAKGVPVMSFEMPVEGWRQLLWKLVDLARPHGLVVVDSELMLAFLPTGKVYPESRQSDWDEIASAFSGEEKREAAENLPRTVRQYIKWSKPIYEAYLKENGFLKRGKGALGDLFYHKDFDFISASVCFNYQMEYPVFFGLHAMAISCPSVCDILKIFNVRTLDDMVFYLLLSDQTADVLTSSFPAVSLSSVKFEIDLFDKYVVTVLREITTLQKLDVFLTDLPGFSERARFNRLDYVPHRLVIAKLADRPDFETFAADLRATIPPLHQKSLDQFDQIAEYLKQISPL